MSDNRGQVTSGLILIALGAAFLVIQFFEQISGSAVLLALGLAFLVAHFVYRVYGLLIPGCILLGLGAGVLVEEMTSTGDAVVLGLGAGFIVIWLIDGLITHTGPRASWWPLIPGGVLLLVGIGSYFGGLEEVFPLAAGLFLLALGTIILLRVARRPDSGSE